MLDNVVVLSTTGQIPPNLTRCTNRRTISLITIMQVILTAEILAVAVVFLSIVIWTSIGRVSVGMVTKNACVTIDSGVCRIPGTVLPCECY